MSATCCGVMSAVISGRQLLGGSFPPKRALVRVIPALKYPSSTSAKSKPIMGHWITLITSFWFKPILGVTCEHTISFLDYLQAQRPSQRIAIIWDGASYHRSQEVKDYLQSLNTGRPQPSWQLVCIRFAPNAPEQNPVEDVWLQAKRFLREFYHLCDSFSLTKLLFELVTHGRTFNFPKLFKYAVVPQPT